MADLNLRDKRDPESPGAGNETDQTPVENQGTAERDAEEMELDQIFELLKNPRRRTIIEYLRSAETGSSTTDELAKHIAARENDVEVSELTSQQRKRVYIALYQCHLPKMDRFGVIDFHKKRGTVELGDIGPLEAFLTDSNDDGPDRVTLGFAITVAAIVTVGVTGVGVLSAVPVAFWTALSVGALLLVAAT